MKRFGWMLLLLVSTTVLVAYPLAAETLSQCLTNCPPGNNSCTQCCFAELDAAAKPCNDACTVAQSSCFDAAIQSCQNSPHKDACVRIAILPCLQAQYACQRACEETTQIAGGCPGEVPPQKCPYDCQSWNSASKTCVGAPVNGCGSSQGADQAPPKAVPADAAQARIAASAGKCPYDCQSWDAASGQCLGEARSGCEIYAARAKAAAAAAEEATKQMKAEAAKTGKQ